MCKCLKREFYYFSIVTKRNGMYIQINKSGKKPLSLKGHKKQSVEQVTDEVS
jgi:hypothetical protein